MSTVQASKRIPPLENGDRLTRAEFERRYEAMPRLKKAELIDGEVFMGSPVSLDRHGEQHSKLIGWMIVYEASTPGTVVGDNFTVRLDSKNEPQPDAALMVRPEFGGQVKKCGKYVAGGPELVAEVSGTTAGIDLNRKMNVYRRHAVREYIVWRTQDEELDWFVLRGKEYVRLEPDPADGLIKSTVFPGLWLDAAALVKLDVAKVLAALARGVASPEHAECVKRLAAAHASK
jgi:Uma2 family endonuclease